MGINDFKIEYDGAKDKFYLSNLCGELIATFYGGYALKEFLNDTYGLCGAQVESAINAAY